MLRNNQFFVSPDFRDLLLSQKVEDPIEDRILSEIKKHYTHTYFFPFDHFEAELQNLWNGLNIGKFADKYFNAVALLFRSFIEEILENQISLNTFNQIDKSLLFTKNNIFNKIYNLLEEYFKVKLEVNSVNETLVVVSGGINEYDQRTLYENLKYPGTRKIKIKTQISQDTLNFDKLFSENPYLFINGHGDNAENGGLQYYFNIHNSFILDGAIIAKNARNLKVLGLLSCGYNSYKKYLHLSQYTILADKTSTVEYTEMFIKTFHLFAIKTNHIELSLKLALSAILFRSNAEFSFTIYKGENALDV